MINHKNSDFYVFEKGALSTFSKEESEDASRLGYKIKRGVKIPVCQLKNVLKKYVNSRIDFMSVDTEGLTPEVLKSNDWTKYRPELLCIETTDFIDFLTTNKDGVNTKKILDKYLQSIGYQEYVDNGLNTIYQDIRVKN